MPYVRKRGKRWRAEVNITKDFQRYHDSRTFDTKAEAVSWGVRRKKEIMLGQIDAVDTSKSLRDAIIRYIDEVIPHRHSGEREVLRLRYFLKCPGLNVEARLASISPDIFKEFIKFRLQDVMTSTVNREITLLRSVIREAQKWRWLDHNPFESVEFLKEPPPRNRRISPHEEEAILEALGYDEHTPPKQTRQRLAIMFLLALETGMRLSEICNLDWNNINLKQRYLTIPKSKNGDSRDIPLSSRAIELLLKVKGHSKTLIHDRHGEDEYGRKYSYRAMPVFYKNYAKSSDSASALFAKYVRQTGIKDLRFHDTRHEACTRLAQKIDVLDLAKMIGHRDPRSLMIYYNPTATEIAKRLG